MCILLRPQILTAERLKTMRNLTHIEAAHEAVARKKGMEEMRKNKQR